MTAEASAQRGVFSTARSFVRMTKPIIIGLLLFTTLAGMVIAARGMPNAQLLVFTLLGGALASGGANTINQYIERDLDTMMARTSRRPIPSGEVRPIHALIFGVLLSVLSFVVLVTFVNLLSAALSLAGILYYVFVYTLWLKRRSTLNIVIGGAAGAIPPVVGWVAVTNQLTLLPVFLFAIIYYWTPPHTWALVMLVEKDYLRASVPMMPVALGPKATQLRIMLYTLLLVPLTLLMTPLGMMGWIYLAAAGALGAWHIVAAMRVWRRGTKASYRSLYKFSTMYLTLLFLAMMVDRAAINF